ncbi:hypothetical protein DFP72DRAFT_787799, partial [Ephemerocybe angulata]
PPSPNPSLATGTIAGALDESFSNESLRFGYQISCSGTSTTSAFNCLVRGYVNSNHPSGLIAAGLVNGELALWDPDRILAGD